MTSDGSMEELQKPRTDRSMGISAAGNLERFLSPKLFKDITEALRPMDLKDNHMLFPTKYLCIFLLSGMVESPGDLDLTQRHYFA